MGLAIAKLPGGKDINDQFTPGINIHKALACLKRIKKNGTYEFGALTACFYNLTGNELTDWTNEVKSYPPSAQDEIKNCIIQALTHKDASGKDDPIPVTLNWTGGANGVKCTYNPSPPSYTIEISGYPSLMASALAERRERKKT